MNCRLVRVVLAKVREMVLPTIEKDGPIEAWIITQHNLDTGGQIPGAQTVQTIGGHGGQGQNVIQSVIQRRSLENYALEITNENRTTVVVAFPLGAPMISSTWRAKRD
jgi:hypothetical protein